MKRPLLGLLTALLLLAAVPPAGAAEPLRIAFIAYQSPDQLLSDVRPVIAYLEDRLGVEVRHFAATSYAGVVEALRNGTADIGFMGPLQYVLAHQQTGAEPLLGEVYNGSPTYVSRVFVRKDSGLRQLSELKGKTMAFVDPISSSGYLYPLDTFRQAGLIEGRDDAERFFRRIYFAGGDEQAIRAVLNGFVDAAGIGQYSYQMLRPDERDQLVAVADSRPIPSHCVVARRELSEARKRAFKQALLALNEGPNHGLLKTLYNVDGYVSVSHEDFVGVEAVARDHGFLPTKVGK